MKNVLVVLDEKALAYYIQGRETMQIMSAPTVSVRGQIYHDFQIVHKAGARYRLASEKDFDKFKVSFKGYDEDGYHIHAKSPEAKEERAGIFSKLYEEKEAQDKLHDRACGAVAEYSHLRGDMGLLPDEVRESFEYRQVSGILQKEFQSLRKINGYLSRHYKVEMRKRSIEKRGY